MWLGGLWSVELNDVPSSPEVQQVSLVKSCRSMDTSGLKAPYEDSTTGGHQVFYICCSFTVLATRNSWYARASSPQPENVRGRRTLRQCTLRSLEAPRHLCFPSSHCSTLAPVRGRGDRRWEPLQKSDSDSCGYTTPEALDGVR